MTSIDVGDATEMSLKSLALIYIVKAHDTSVVAFTKLFPLLTKTEEQTN